MPFESSNPVARADWLRDFLSFEKMLMPVLIKGIFALSLVACIFVSALLGLSGVVDAFRGSAFGLAKLLLAIVILVIGSLVARLWCEFLIVIFRIHDCLEQIARNTAPRG